LDPFCLQPLDHSIPARTIGKGAVHEDDGGLGVILRVCVHGFLLAEGIAPSSLLLMVAIRGEAVNRGYSRFALTLLNEQVSEKTSSRQLGG
jgi:hypothetical protein